MPLDRLRMIGGWTRHPFGLSLSKPHKQPEPLTLLMPAYRNHW